MDKGRIIWRPFRAVHVNPQDFAALHPGLSSVARSALIPHFAARHC
jgi:hypothetical protein